MNEILQKSLKFNTTVNILEGGFFGLGIGFASFSTILPLFVSTMTDSAILIGLIPAIHGACWMLPQVFTAERVRRQKRFKPGVLLLTSQERIPFLGLALVAWLAADLGNRWALVLVFMLITWQSLGAGFTATGWQSLIAKIIPADRRGTFFGAQAAAANLLASVSAILAGQILERLSSPLDFILCFVLCFAAMVVSWFILALTREPESAIEDPHKSAHSYWSELGAILRRDGNFRRFLAARSISQIGTMAFAFYIVYAVRIYGISEAQAGVLTGVLMTTQIIANPLMGWIGDRWSRRKLIGAGMVAAASSALIAWWAPSAAWFYLVVVLAGIATVSVWTIGIAFTLEFGREAERPVYIGLANSLVAPATILAPFLAGWLADLAGYSLTFAASAAGGLFAWLFFQFVVKDPAPQKLATAEPILLTLPEETTIN